MDTEDTPAKPGEQTRLMSGQSSSQLSGPEQQAQATFRGVLFTVSALVVLSVIVLGTSSVVGGNSSVVPLRLDTLTQAVPLRGVGAGATATAHSSDCGGCRQNKGTRIG